MKRVTYTAIALLLFNGLGALFGGGMLLAYPDGSGFQMPLSLLEHSPFHDFFWPGLILFVCNGCGSLLVAGLLFSKNKYGPLGTMVQGAVLTGWIVIQVAIIQGFSPLHAIFGSIGIALIVLGWWMLRKHFSAAAQSPSPLA